MNAVEFVGRDLADSIASLESMPQFLEGAIERAAPAGLTRRGSDGFSLVEHACHLRDLEREGYLVRVRRTLAEAVPSLETFDGEAVANARDYLREDAKRAAREFGAARRELLGLLAGLDAAALAREAVFEGRRLCLADLVAMMTEHDRGHRRDIARLLGGMPWK